MKELLAAVCIGLILPSSAVATQSTLALSNAAVEFRFDTTNGTVTRACAAPGCPASAESIQLASDRAWKLVMRNTTTPYGLFSQTPASAPIVFAQPGAVVFVWHHVIDSANDVVIEHTYLLNPQSTQDFMQLRTRVWADGSDPYGLSLTGTTTLGIHEVQSHFTPTRPSSGYEDFGIVVVRDTHAIHGPTTYLSPQFTRDTPTFNDPDTGSYWSEDGIRDETSYRKITGVYWQSSTAEPVSQLGLYVFPERSTGYQPTTSAYKSLPNNRFQMAHIEYAPNESSAGVNFEPANDLRVGIFRPTASRSEGWIDFVRLYRSYLENSTLTFSQNGATRLLRQRTDLNTHAKLGGQVLGYFGIDTDPSPHPWTDPLWRQNLSSLHLASASHLGATQHGVQFFIGWNSHRTQPHSLYAMKPGQKELFELMNSTGVAPAVLYVLMNRISGIHTAPNCPHEQVDPLYPAYQQFVARNVDGSIYSNCDAVYNAEQTIDYGTRTWPSMIMPRIQYLSQVGSAGYYLDNPIAPADFGGGRTHLPGFGEYQLADVAWTLDTVRAGIRQVRPDSFAFSESHVEPLSMHSDFQNGDFYSFTVPPWLFANSHADKYLGAWRDNASAPINAAIAHSHVPLYGYFVFDILDIRFPDGQIDFTQSILRYAHHSARAALESGVTPGYSEMGTVLAFLFPAIPEAAWIPNHDLLAFVQLPWVVSRLDEASNAQVSAMASYADRYAKIQRDIVAFRKATFGDHLVQGEWMPRLSINDSTYAWSTFAASSSNPFSYRTRSVAHGAWKSPTDGSVALFFARPAPENQVPSALSFTFSTDSYGLNRANNEWLLIERMSPNGTAAQVARVQANSAYVTFPLAEDEVVCFRARITP